METNMIARKPKMEFEVNKLQCSVIGNRCYSFSEIFCGNLGDATALNAVGKVPRTIFQILPVMSVS